MPNRIVVLGAGFGGLELATRLSEALGDELEVTLIDKGDSFVFGYSKLDVMFGRTTLEAVRLPYARAREARRALPAGDGHRDRSRGAARDDRRGRPRGRRPGRRARRRLRLRRDARASPRAATSSTRSPARSGWRERAARRSRSGRAVIGVCGAPFKCPPAPSEAALLLHDYLVGARRARRLRDLVRDPASDARSRRRPRPRAALVAAFAERDIEFVPGPSRRARSTPDRSVAVLDDGSELPYDLFLGVPKHRAPDVVIASGMTEDGYVPVDSRTLRDALPRRLRGRRRGDGRRAEGGRVRRGRGAGRRGQR